jgi:hypothetical protein
MSQRRDQYDELDEFAEAMELTEGEALAWRRENTIFAQLADPFIQAGEFDRFVLLYSGLQSVIRETVLNAVSQAYAAAAVWREEAVQLARIDQLREDCAVFGCAVPDQAIALEAEIHERAAIRVDEAARLEMRRNQAFARERMH